MLNPNLGSVGLALKIGTSLFIYNYCNFMLYFLIYVDDLIITGNNNKHMRNLIRTIDIKFSICDLGTIQYFLGIEVKRTLFTYLQKVHARVDMLLYLPITRLDVCFIVHRVCQFMHHPFEHHWVTSEKDITLKKRLVMVFPLVPLNTLQFKFL